MVACASALILTACSFPKRPFECVEMRLVNFVKYAFFNFLAEEDSFKIAYTWDWCFAEEEPKEGASSGNRISKMRV